MNSVAFNTNKVAFGGTAGAQFTPGFSPAAAVGQEPGNDQFSSRLSPALQSNNNFFGITLLAIAAVGAGLFFALRGNFAQAAETAGAGLKSAANKFMGGGEAGVGTFSELFGESGKLAGKFKKILPAGVREEVNAALKQLRKAQTAEAKAQEAFSKLSGNEGIFDKLKDFLTGGTKFKELSKADAKQLAKATRDLASAQRRRFEAEANVARLFETESGSIFGKLRGKKGINIKPSKHAGFLKGEYKAKQAIAEAEKYEKLAAEATAAGNNTEAARLQGLANTARAEAKVPAAKAQAKAKEIHTELKKQHEAMIGHPAHPQHSTANSVDKDAANLFAGKVQRAEYREWLLREWAEGKIPVHKT